MPDYDPNNLALFDPAHGKPVVESVPPGTFLYRVHQGAYAAHELNPTTPGRFDGGRFDSDDGSYSYIYASTACEGAIAERLMRVLKFGSRPRLLPKASVSGLVMSELRVVRPIAVLSLVGADASQVGQDLWLTTCEPIDYARTRLWAKAIRGWVPALGGFKYLARNDQLHRSFVLFGPPGGGADPRLVATGRAISLETPDGFQTVKAVLVRHNATFSSS